MLNNIKQDLFKGFTDSCYYVQVGMIILHLCIQIDNYELTMPPTDYFENQITFQRIQNVVHTNVPYKNQMYIL